ncbi:MAG: hypothetical protein A4E52_00992 [Pelotomaculum sp. PtaB.Bin013]|uniref:Essential protein Yae1 N-terminal domain-containing protein n=1 Tax=Pelotomaculum isophthalicicum JI TaxID=947010 RepID=A0A9X4H3P5_9FIRM|nr:hypothetical protein [Pelotomaculum isophthalicicum]MDF9407082.1 hypothetical protein [Pelotomaculum isophthalicicum JI]OPX89546.1 MAG: hypothetical protein A4E52_00992 [Pelotomaculum sp. PtaB.Bin013]
MGEEKKGKNEQCWTHGRQKDLGYHLGYNLGFESGFEKGYTEGSALGYNNGFLAALRLSEGSGAEESPGADPPYGRVYQVIRKLVDSGQLSIFLSGCAAREAETLFKLLLVDVHVVTKALDNCR